MSPQIRQEENLVSTWGSNGATRPPRPGSLGGGGGPHYACAWYTWAPSGFAASLLVEPKTLKLRSGLSASRALGLYFEPDRALCDNQGPSHLTRWQRLAELGGRFRMKRPSFWTICLALVPFLAMCFSVPLWDRIYPMVFGLPFNMCWLLSWIVLTSMCMWRVYRLETARISKDPAAAARTHPNEL